MGQKGRTLTEKHAECRQPDITHRILGIATASSIGEILDASAE